MRQMPLTLFASNVITSNLEEQPDSYAITKIALRTIRTICIIVNKY
jgi:hypothetical protein